MKKYAITALEMTNVGMLRGVQLTPKHQQNILVEGENGTGKSTIKKALDWIFTGYTTDGEKLIPVDSGEMPIVSVTISDGKISTTYRKELAQRQQASRIMRTTMKSINELETPCKNLAEFFNTQGIPLDIFEAMIDLGSFFRMKPDSQRAILTKHFSAISDEKILQEPEFEDLKTLDLAAVKERITTLDKKISRIPAQIDVLNQMRMDEDLEGRLDALRESRTTLEGQLKDVNKELAKAAVNLSRANIPQQKIEEISKNLSKLRKQFADGERIISIEQAQLDRLRQDWLAAESKCPTCGQKVRTETTIKVREHIADAGRQVAEKIEIRRKNFKDIQENIATQEKELEFIKSKLSDDNSAQTQFTELQNQVNSLQREYSDVKAEIARVEEAIKSNQNAVQKIRELSQEQKKLGQELSHCEKIKALIEAYNLRKAELITKEINQHFQHVRFRLFARLKSGALQSTCEATVGGVPYSLLSKGEKMKAALDILQAFQRFYDVQFPIIIDDAESYTSNSLLQISNQKIILRVAEGLKSLDISFK